MNFKLILTLILILTQCVDFSWSVPAGIPSVLAPSAVLIPNIGQYLAMIHILLMKLVVATQILRLLGLDYVGKGIKSAVSGHEFSYTSDGTLDMI